MALFQRPATTPDEVERSKPLPLSPDEVAEMDEETWYQRAYRGDGVPQLTARAVLMGTGLGFVLAFTNLYVGLKTGWGIGVALTACILSFSLWNLLQRVGLARSQMSILETNCMQSTASAAGYSTGNGLVSAIPALLLLGVTAERPGGTHLPWWVLGPWTFCVASLGVALAIPMKRNMINHERLKFPSGVAAAVTLQSLFSRGAEALAKARALFAAAAVSGLTPLLMDLRLRKGGGLVPAESHLFDFLRLGTHPRTGEPLRASDWTILLDHKLVLVGAGMIVGLRMCLSMALGGLVVPLLLGPAALAAGAAEAPATAWREIGIWVGAPMLVSSALLAFAFQWRTIARAFRGLARRASGAPSDAEVPPSWFVVGFVVAGFGVIAMARAFFGVPLHLAALAIILTFVLTLVACRATGESDITPVSAMGKMMQLTYGVLIPQNGTANLMTAAITANSSASAADLLVDLKSGYLLGASARRQFVAQLMGVLPGTIASVIGFYLLVPDATALTGAGGRAPEFPAPAAQAWLAVARVFEQGLSSLHPMARQAIVWGLVAGAALVLLETLMPKAARRFVPSATGVGLGLILPFQYPLSFVIGAVVAWIWTARRKEIAERYVVPVSSGIIAGESIVGVVVTAVNNFVLR